MPDIEKLAMEIANAALATHGNTKGPYAGFMVIGETELGDLITRHLTAWAGDTKDEGGMMATFMFHGRDGKDYYDIGIRDGCGQPVPAAKIEEATDD